MIGWFAPTLAHPFHESEFVGPAMRLTSASGAPCSGTRRWLTIIGDKSHAPSHWTLADRAGNRVCICAWPDGAIQKPSAGPGVAHRSESAALDQD